MAVPPPEMWDEAMKRYAGMSISDLMREAERLVCFLEPIEAPRGEAGKGGSGGDLRGGREEIPRNAARCLTRPLSRNVVLFNWRVLDG